MIRTMVLLSLLAATAGCAQRTHTAMNAMLGKSDMELLALWGAPDLETTSGGQGRHLTWIKKTPEGVTICRRSFTVIDHRVEAAVSNCAW